MKSAALLLLSMTACFGQRAATEYVNPSTISLGELAHRIPQSAQKEYAIAMKAYEKHNEVEAIHHLKEAISIDPEFLSAINNLGVIYTRLYQYDEALESFNQVIALNPRVGYAYGNLALVYLFRNGWEDAERAARRSLGLDSSNTRAMLCLGISLVKQHKFNKEAERSLRAAASAAPLAKFWLGVGLLEGGDFEGAANQLSEYIASVDEEEEYVNWAQKLISKAKQTTVAASFLP